MQKHLKPVLFSNCYNGNFNTKILTNLRCGVVDLRIEFNLMLHELVLCFEIAEHVPSRYKDIIVENIDKLNTEGCNFKLSSGRLARALSC